MNPQFQAQDMQQQQLQGLPVNLLRAQQQQQQLQLLQQQRLLQKQQRQMYNPQVLVGQNTQLPIQLQYQLQQQYQQQQLQQIQLLKQKQSQGIIAGQESLDQTAFSNPLLYQQNQLLQQQQQTQFLQQSPQQLPQNLLLDPTQTNISTSQQLLKSNSLGPTTIIGQSPTLSAKQTIIQQQLAQQQKLKLINQSPVQPQGTLKTSTPQLPVQTKVSVPVSTAPAKTNSITVTAPPTTQTQSLFKNPMSVVDFQTQLSSQPSLTSQIPTSAINLDQFTKSSILNIPTSTNALITTTAPSTSAFVSSALAVSSIPSLDSLSKTLPLSTTLALPTASTQAVTAQITSMSPLNKPQTSLQLSQAQLQSQLAKQIKTSQKSPISKAQIKVPTPTITPSTTTLQNLNQIKKPAKQTSPTAISQSSLVNIPSSKIATTNRLNSTTTVEATSNVPKTNTPAVTTTSNTTTPTLAAEKSKPKRIPSTTINSITIPTPTSQMLNSTLSNTNLQNYQSLIQLQTPQQQKLNLTQLANSQIKIPSSDKIKDELEKLTSPNDILLNGLTGKTTTTTLNNNATKKSAATTPVENTTKKSNSIDQASDLKTPQTPTLNSAIKSESTTKNSSLLNKSEPITHININYNGTNEDINSVLYGKLSNNFNVNKTSADVSPLNPSYNSKTLVNPIYGQQPSSQSEKIISKGSYFLKCYQLFYVLRKEAKYREISFWKRFTSNYFSDKAIFKINILNMKCIELKRAIIPQYFDVLTKSEIISTNLSFGAIDERYPGDGSCNLETKESIIIFSYEGVQVNWYGNIKVLFDKTGKVELYEFIVKDIKKFYENSPYPKSNYPILNEIGMPTTVKRFVEIYEVVNKMDDLINCSIAWNVGPKKALSQYANQYRQELKSTQQLKNLKLNRMGSVTSPVLPLSNAETLTNAQNYNTNSLLDMDMMPPPQAPSTSNSAHSSNLNSASDTVTNSLNKKRLAGTVPTTTLSPTSNSINAINTGTNSITVSNAAAAAGLNLSSINTSLAGNVALNLPTSSSVLSNLTATSAALSNAGINLSVSSAAALSSAISAVNFNALSKANINSTAAMSNILSPLNMDLTGEPKAKKLKTTSTSPRQRKNKTPTSRTVATKNRRNSNNSSTISS